MAIVSPSFAAPAAWPEVYQIALNRLKNDFGLIPVEYPSTAKIGATKEERPNDLIAAFSDPEIKAVIATIGGDDQITYIKSLPREVFKSNPKPFFGYSDNTQFVNFLWMCDIPSYYGACLFTQFAMPSKIDAFTDKFLRLAFFESGEFELEASPVHSEYSTTNWSIPETMKTERIFIPNDGWHWEVPMDSENAEIRGISWGGCLESIDELLRHGVEIPSLDDLKGAVLFFETSEEQPDTSYVHRVLRALGERGILGNSSAILVGRPETWSRDATKTHEDREQFRHDQRDIVLKTIRAYNQTCPIIQNVDIGHTHPQIPLPNGKNIRIIPSQKKIFAEF